VVLPDVNVLIYAHREEAARHVEYRRWLESVLDGPSAFGLSDLVLSSFLRVVTHPRALRPPTPMDRALAFVEALRRAPQRVAISPGPRHWEIFQALVRGASAKGNLVADAYLAALAIESGCEWVTTDRDFARFPGLRWRHPLD
jgi:toxin-antitoxin system PIN domain toxin